MRETKRRRLPKLELKPSSPHQRALDFFWSAMPERMLEITSRGTVVLHHKDVTLKKRDPERYAEWRPEDLEPMEKREHISMHNKKPHSRKHNKKIGEAVRKAREELRGAVIVAFDPVTEDIAIYPSVSSAACSIGCSRQWAGQCLRNGWKCFGQKLLAFDGSDQDFREVSKVISSQSREEIS